MDEVNVCPVCRLTLHAFILTLQVETIYKATSTLHNNYYMNSNTQLSALQSLFQQLPFKFILYDLTMSRLV